MIAAGLDGVEKGMELAEPVEESLFEMDAAQIAAKSIRELPGTLGEALDELEKDDVIREALGDHVFSHFIDAKRAEWDEYRTQVSDWEVGAISRTVLGPRRGPRRQRPRVSTRGAVRAHARPLSIRAARDPEGLR